MEAQPKETIAKGQSGSGVLALEDSDLLPEGGEFQSQVMSRAEDGIDRLFYDLPDPADCVRDSQLT